MIFCSATSSYLHKALPTFQAQDMSAFHSAQGGRVIAENFLGGMVVSKNSEKVRFWDVNWHRRHLFRKFFKKLDNPPESSRKRVRGNFFWRLETFDFYSDTSPESSKKWVLECQILLFTNHLVISWDMHKICPDFSEKLGFETFFRHRRHCLRKLHGGTIARDPLREGGKGGAQGAYPPNVLPGVRVVKSTSPPPLLPENFLKNHHFGQKSS